MEVAGAGSPEPTDDTTQSLSERLQAQVEAKAGTLVSRLNGQLAQLAATPTLSRSTRQAIERRVPPKLLQSYFAADKAINLLAIDLESIGARISRYQYIERYREHFDPPSNAMRVAFVGHTHVLRGSEIYVIAEQCGAWLSFYANVAQDLGIAVSDQRRVLQRKFKSEFERHLRERHRIVHAHERPSATSRMIDVPSDPNLAAVFTQHTLSMTSVLTERILRAAPHLRADTNEELIQNINRWRLEYVDRECETMWAIFSQAIDET